MDCVISVFDEASGRLVLVPASIGAGSPFQGSLAALRDRIHQQLGVPQSAQTLRVRAAPADGADSPLTECFIVPPSVAGTNSLSDCGLDSRRCNLVVQGTIDRLGSPVRSPSPVPLQPFRSQPTRGENLIHPAAAAILRNCTMESFPCGTAASPIRVHVDLRSPLKNRKHWTQKPLEPASPKRRGREEGPMLRELERAASPLKHHRRRPCESVRCGDQEETASPVRLPSAPRWVPPPPTRRPVIARCASVGSTSSDDSDANFQSTRNRCRVAEIEAAMRLVVRAAPVPFR